MTEKNATPSIAITPVESSSNIKGYGYDVPTSTLAIQFKTGATYHYAAVPSKVYDELRDAKSAGSFISQHIIKRFNAVRVV